MARVFPPAVIQLRRAQLTLILATLVPTVLITALGIILLATGRGTAAVVIGVLVLAFTTTLITGYILVSIFVRRGAQVIHFQHDYLSLVSHELRTPLTSILMFVETLRDDRLTDPEEKRQCLVLLDQEVRRLDSLLGRLLQLSKLQARGHRFARAPVVVSEVVRDALVAFEAATWSDKAQVEVAMSAPDATVQGDREALAQAVTNLLMNAWKYTRPEDRRIVLTVSGSERSVEIAVSDNGPGIALEEQERVFEQFERGRTAQASGRPGSGLGLAIVRAVVRAHRGRVNLRSRPGEGAELRIRLPRLRGAAP